MYLIKKTIFLTLKFSEKSNFMNKSNIKVK